MSRIHVSYIRGNEWLKFKIEMDEDLRKEFNNFGIPINIRNRMVFGFLKEEDVLKTSKRRRTNDGDYYVFDDYLEEPTYRNISYLNGFRNLMVDSDYYLFDDSNAAEKFCSYVARNILIQLQVMKGDGTISGQARLTFGHKGPTVPKINLELPSLLSMGGNIYEISLRETGAESLEDIAMEAEKNIGLIHKSQLDGVIQAFEKEKARMQQDIENIKSSSFHDALKVMISSEKLWKFTIEHGNLVAEYQLPIIAENVDFNGRIWEIPEDLRGHYFIEGFKLIVSGSRSYSTRCERGWHTNCDGHNVCIGDLYGRPIQDAIRLAPDTLKTMCIASGYHGRTEAEIKKIIVERDIQSKEKLEVWGSNHMDTEDSLSRNAII